jgi:aminopeptidase N
LNALGRAVASDPFWGVRVQAIAALGRLNTPEAAQKMMAALNAPEPWVREPAVSQLVRFHNLPDLAPQFATIYRSDPAFGVRAAALVALAQSKSPDAFETLRAALDSDSPRDLLRNAALRGLGLLGDERAVPLLVDWSAPGQPLDSRPAAISGLAHVGLKDRRVEDRLIAYASEPYPGVRLRAFRALADRGDPAAIAPLEALVRSGQLGEEAQQQAQAAINRLRRSEPKPTTQP